MEIKSAFATGAELVLKRDEAKFIFLDGDTFVGLYSNAVVGSEDVAIVVLVFVVIVVVGGNCVGVLLLEVEGVFLS